MSYQYNIDFLIAGLTFLLLIFHHFMRQRTMDLENNRPFLWLVVTGIANIFFDLLTALLVMWHNPALTVFTEISLIIMFLLQILVPHALLYYVKSQFPPNPKYRVGHVILIHLVPLIVGGLLILNHWTHMYFTVFPDGTYIRGPIYLSMYIIASVYLLASGLYTLAYRKSMRSSKVHAVWELVCFAGITVLIQTFHNSFLVTGFGITMGITVLFLTLNNPFHYTDSLTATFDIRYFRDRAKSNRDYGKEFHLISVDLSQLKRVNLVQGTNIGNQLLTITAQMLRKLDKRALVFRVAGNRFIVMVPTRSQYQQTCAKIKDFFSEPVKVGEDFVQCPAIICGITDAQHARTSDNLLAYVEYLVDHAPSTTDTCLIQDDSNTLKGFHYNLEIENYLQTALDENLFDIVYQPVFSIPEQRYLSAEVLSRLNHPTLGPVPPDIFITIAEKNDQVAKIGLLQLQRVCKFLSQHPEICSKLSSIKMNLSGAELLKPHHAEDLIEIIQSYQIPTNFFQFEITETVATEYGRSLDKVIKLFSDAGIGLCMDDFGSGYANLNSVLKIPFRAIKMDRSLILDIHKDQRTAFFYRSLVSSLRNLGFSVISEGVETKEELDLVSKWGVNYIQGYYFSKPLPGPQFLQTIFAKQ